MAEVLATGVVGQQIMAAVVDPDAVSTTLHSTPPSLAAYGNVLQRSGTVLCCEMRLAKSTAQTEALKSC